ncbi:hypothetical protein, partial [Mitsuokella jalaludinii]|uniref:hypothetical protein n=1 Tax=Mitsuokella jalaludinii TaxID=187979 RepID=UPI001B80314A
GCRLLLQRQAAGQRQRRRAALRPRELLVLITRSGRFQTQSQIKAFHWQLSVEGFFHARILNGIDS